MEPRTDPVGLRMSGLGPCVIKVLDRQIQFILMLLGFPAGLSPAVGPDSVQGDVMPLKERHHAVVQQLGGSEGRRPIVQLRKAHFAVRVDEGLLRDPAHALEGPTEKVSWGATVAGTVALEFATGRFVDLRFFQGHHLGLGHNHAFLGHLRVQCLQPFPRRFEIMPEPDASDTG